MSTTKKTRHAEKDPDAPGQLLIRRSNRDLDWIRQSAEERGMEYKDFVFAACQEFANRKTARLVAYLDPAALPTLQHLTAELQRKHRDLAALMTVLMRMEKLLCGKADSESTAHAAPNEAGSGGPPQTFSDSEQALRKTLAQTQDLHRLTRWMLQEIWRAMR